MRWPEEMVLVVPRKVLFGGERAEQGFGARNLDLYLARIEHSYQFLPRARVEEDPSLKQIIPYVLVTHGERILLLKRRENQTEARLHNLYSIGVGGHINPPDEKGGDPVEAGLKRELAEEIRLPEDFDLSPVGYINDDSNAVGSVHFGLVFRARSPSDAVEIVERERMEGGFASLPRILEKRGRMETWSRLLADAIRDDPSLAFP